MFGQSVWEQYTCSMTGTSRPSLMSNSSFQDLTLLQACSMGGRAWEKYIGGQIQATPGGLANLINTTQPGNTRQESPEDLAACASTAALLETEKTSSSFFHMSITVSASSRTKSLRSSGSCQKMQIRQSSSSICYASCSLLL
jgi:hypothetical protein